MANAPSIKSLLESFPHITEESAKKIRAIIHKDGKLGAINILIDGYGVEYLEYSDSTYAGAYVNMGDAYNATILKTANGAFRLTTWGDFVETSRKRIK